jgi:hypothetical protein
MGMLAIFCDMEAQWHGEFRDWLNEDMFPARLRLDFPACASYDVISGQMGEESNGALATAPPFLTIYETPSISDLYGEPYQGLRRDRAPRDREMHERMIGMERYTLTLVGPLVSRDGDSLAPFAYVDRFDLRPSDVQPFNIWFEAEYLPWCSKLPSLLRVRRYLAMEGAPRHLVFHEFSDTKFQDDPLWRALRNAKEWLVCAMTYGAPALYQRVAKAP